MEIELYSKLNNPIEAIEKIGTMFARSGMFGCEKSEQGQVLAMICLAERKSPVAITRTFHIIDGRLSKKALAVLAEFRAIGGKHKWIKTGDDGQEAELELTLEGQTIRSKFTMEEAKRQGLVRPKSNWEKTPSNMLRARCISNGVAMLAPEIVAGDDAEDSSSPAPAKELKLEAVAAPQIEKVVTLEVVPPVAAPPAPVVAPAANPDEAVEAAMGLAPAQPQAAPQAPPQAAPAAPAEKPFAKGPKLDPGTKPLPEELAQQVETAIGEHGPAAVNWMLKNGWLKPGQDFTALREPQAKRIINNRDSFLRAIQGGAK